jgi:nucleotide-binding universal stress UspA family protein
MAQKTPKKAASRAINIAKVAGAELCALYVISTRYAVTTRSVKGWTGEFEEGLAKGEELQFVM